MTSKKLTAVSALGAALLWGGWAFYVNYEAESLGHVVRTSILQGLYSGAMTLYMSLAVFFFSKHTRRWPLPWMWPAFFTVAHTGLVLAAVHMINHTPNLLKTISAPLLVSSIYCLVMSKKYT